MTLNKRDIVFVFAPAILLFAICRLFDFNGLYGQDSYEYLRYSEAIKHFFITGAPAGKFFWPAGYPFAGALFSFIFQNVNIALQLVSILAFTLSACLLRKCIHLLFGQIHQSTIWYIALFYFLSPYMLRFSVLVMSDMLCVFFITSVYYYYLKLRQSPNIKHYIWLLIFALFAIFTRYGAIIIILPACISGIFLLFKRYTKKVFTISLIGIIITLGLIVLAFNRFSSLSFLNHPWLTNWSLMNFFKNDFQTPDGHEHFHVINFLYSFQNMVWPAFFFAGLILVFFTKLTNFNTPGYTIIFSGFILYALFLAGIPFQNLRFLLLSFPLIILLFYPAFIRIKAKITKKPLRIYTVMLIVLLQLLFCCKALQYVIVQNKLEKEIAGKLQENQRQLAVYTLGMEGVIHHYLPGIHVISLYNKDMANIQKPSLLLIDSAIFSHQYANMLPTINLNYIMTIGHLKPLHTFPQGWNLYEIN